MTIHDDLREVMGLLGNIVPPQKPLPELLLATYHEARGWNACREAMLGLIRQHGPTLLARQEGEDAILQRISNPHRWSPEMSKAWHNNIPDMTRAFNALIEAARSGGGGSVVKFSDTDGWDYGIHQDPIP